jgi:hypothetical protein
MRAPRILLAILFFAGGLARAQEPTNLQGLWWAHPPGSQSGWGINIEQQGGILFATWFGYANGQPRWWVVSRLDRASVATGADGRFLYVTYQGGPQIHTTGPSFDSASFDPRRVDRIEIPRSSWFLHFHADGTARLESPQIEPAIALTRQVFASPMPQCADGQAPGSPPNYSGLYWASPPGSESGWGVHLAQQADVLFATWFTYGRDNVGTWFVMSEGRRMPTGAFTGTLYRTSIPAAGMFPWNNDAVTRTPVGSATFTFTDPFNGTFAYTVEGVSAVKPITRQLYAAAPTVCR